jgi:uncharacterized membrane protein YdcZ (DUF606 family)
MYVTVCLGLYRAFTGSLGLVTDPPAIQVSPALMPVGAFLILHAFSNGTTAVTGVEAISNGIPAFREPRSRNAAITLLWMAGILGSLFLAISFLAIRIGAVPSERETVISQLARTVFDGRGPLYLGTLAGMTAILVLAANTSFADFPRLSAIQAADGFLPKPLTYRGSRLVYSRGILLLGGVALPPHRGFQGQRQRAHPPVLHRSVPVLHSLSGGYDPALVGKSATFPPGLEVKERGSTLRYERHWWIKMAVNGLGTVCTATVTLVFVITKFHEGAWIVVVLIPVLVALFYAIHRHYRDLAAALSLEDHGAPTRVLRHRVILPISGVHRGTVAAVRYARSLSDDVTAVHVSIDSADAQELQRRWQSWGEGVRLVVLDSTYRTLIEPLLGYIEEIAASRQPNETITIVVPQFVPRHRWHNLLHAQTALVLRLALMFRPGVVITNVPYHLRAPVPVRAEG